MSEEAAERAAFILAEASDLAILCLPAVGEGELDVRRPEVIETVELLPERERDAAACWSAAGERRDGDACADRLEPSAALLALDALREGEPGMVASCD